jgi:hypothetical protein
VKIRPSNPVARRTSFALVKEDFAVTRACPWMPSRDVTVVRIDVRIPCGMKAATTMTTGKKDTKAFAANATLRSTNSISSIRSQTCHTIVVWARVRAAAPRARPDSIVVRAARTQPGSDIGSSSLVDGDARL